MKLHLEPEGRLHSLRRWGVESGGLWSVSIILTVLVLYVTTSVLAWRPGFRFDPTAVIVVFCALELTMVRGLAAACAVGYIGDLFSGHDRGLWWSSAIASYLVLRLLVVRVVGAQPAVVAFLSLVAAIAATFTRICLLHATEQPIPPQAFWGALVIIVGSLLTGYPTYRLFGAVSYRFRPRNDNLFH
ncbi:MAG: hypothetical protein KTR25_15530 [Myxococcales bacterium]|nr:hypothetical protein [Myxococcales bacterium]